MNDTLHPIWISIFLNHFANKITYRYQILFLINFILLGSGELEFAEFCTLAAKFLTEEEVDDEAMIKELREAFRLYDKEGNFNIRMTLPSTQQKHNTIK